MIEESKWLEKCVCVCVRPYLKQPSQSRCPVFSLMVLSEMKAGYSVSHGTCVVWPILWAAGGGTHVCIGQKRSESFYIAKFRVKNTQMQQQQVRKTKQNKQNKHYAYCSSALIWSHITGTLLPSGGSWWSCRFFNLQDSKQPERRTRKALYCTIKYLHTAHMQKMNYII